MSTLVDSNVLVDIYQPNSAWRAWSAQKLAQARIAGRVIINQLIAAEVAAEFDSEERYDFALRAAFLIKEDVPWPATFMAGTAHVRYRRSGGSRERTLPDFLIGAHAMVKNYTLLTRDARRYRAHFPDLDIVAPDTHP
ncbi:type II toxin-antitoxin system VapC family toxin [soil metagenome]